MLERMLPLALKVRFIPATEPWEGDGATPELGFASLELIRRVAEGAGRCRPPGALPAVDR
ncbi:MAG: hypothetical protein AB2807_09175 [Candidatus Sedimenticola endophacoides]